MPSKMIEELKRGVAIAAQDIRSAGSLYNGAAAASNTYLDVSGYTSIAFTANVGVVQSSNTLDLIVTESDTDDPANATAITDASFTQVSDANASTPQYAELRVADVGPYLWVESFKSGTGSCNIGMSYELNGGIVPQSNSPVFDIDGSV